MICGFSGHRPQKLPWGTDEADARCAALKQLLAVTLRRLADEGYPSFLCGMAWGCDFYFAEAVLALKRERPEVRLTALTPCPSQPDGWPLAERLRYRTLLDGCDAVRVLEPGYSPGCMLRRNRAMVDEAELLLTVFDGSAGGTASTVAYARRQGKQILPLWK